MKDTEYDITIQYYDGTMDRFRDSELIGFEHGILEIKKRSKVTYINIDKVKFWTRAKEEEENEIR